MRELLESVAKVARRNGWFVYFRKVQDSGNVQKDKAEVRVNFDRVLDSYFDSVK